MSETSDVLAKVRAALGRSRTATPVPVAPTIPEPIARLVHSEIGLPELFAKRAADNKMDVEVLYVEELMPRMTEFLRAKGCRKLALGGSGLLDKLGVFAALKEAGFDARRWAEMTLDELYDFDCGITDVYCAVAETGSLVMRASREHGRAVSLVPPIHVAVLEPKNFVADLVDLMEKLTEEGVGSNTVLITGPSKTADIEMQLVTGVHGPGVVKLFLLQ